MHLSVGQGSRPTWAISYMASLISSLPHILPNYFHTKFNLFLFPLPCLLSKDIPGFEWEGLSHREQGHALNLFKIMGTLKL